MSWLIHFLEYFIPLFVTIDAFGLVPVFLAVTGGMDARQRRQVSFQAVATATVIAISFMVLGNSIFDFLGIAAYDFKIGGGALLLVLAVQDLLTPGKPGVHEGEMVGVVPLAMPLIAGPATLTTTLVLAKRPAGYAWTALSLAANFALLLGVLLSSTRIARVVGNNALRAFSKLVMVLLAAIAVSYVRSGILDAIREAR